MLPHSAMYLLNFHPFQDHWQWLFGFQIQSVYRENIIDDPRNICLLFDYHCQKFAFDHIIIALLPSPLAQSRHARLTLAHMVQ